MLVGADRSVAEELVQDAFVAAHRTWDGVRDPLAYLRTGGRQPLPQLGTPPDAGARAPSRPPLRTPRSAPTSCGTRSATLPERQRTAIVARFYLDLPDPDIADLLGCRPATVRTAIHRGLATLRKDVPR